MTLWRMNRSLIQIVSPIIIDSPRIMYIHIEKNSKKDLDFCWIDIYPWPSVGLFRFFLGFSINCSLQLSINVGRIANLFDDFLRKNKLNKEYGLLISRPCGRLSCGSQAIVMVPI